jgi:hypothetical protein
VRLTDEQREALYDSLARTVAFLNGIVAAVVPGGDGTKRELGNTDLVTLVVTVPMVRVLEDLQKAGLLGSSPSVGDVLNEEVIYRAMRDRVDAATKAWYMGIVREGYVLGSTILAEVARPMDEERMDEHMEKHLRLLRKLNPTEEGQP